MKYIFPILILLLIVRPAFSQLSMIRDINTEAYGFSSSPANFCELNGILYFSATTNEAGAELWRSDGTDTGTYMVRDINAGSNSSNPRKFVVLNGKLFFQAQTPEFGIEIWESDGTAKGTKIFMDITPGNNSGLQDIVLFKNNLYFGYQGVDSVRGLWKSDGTKTGTFLLKRFFLNAPYQLKVSGNYLYFNGYDSLYGDELWRTDGTASGTFMLRDIYQWANSSYPEELTDVNGILFFIAYCDSLGQELWKSDGTMAGTVLVKNIAPAYGISSSPNELYNANGILYFQANDQDFGYELWRSDGTKSGTFMIKDLVPGYSGSNPFHFLYFKNSVYFMAMDYSGNYGIYRTDGTSAGTSLFMSMKSIDPHFDYMVYGNEMLILQDVDQHFELWKSDGTFSGTQRIYRFNNLKNGISNCSIGTIYKGKAWFSVPDDSLGIETWTTNATGQGTKLFKNINRDGTKDCYGGTVVSMDGILYFPAADRQYNIELWRSDGSFNGTKMVREIFPGLTGSNPHDLCLFGGKLFFAATDTSYGEELYVSDGTDPGTALFMDIVTGKKSSAPRYLNVVGNSLVFLAKDQNNNMCLWKSDGTLTGTIQLCNFNSISQYRGSSYPLKNGLAFFTESSYTTYLWFTDLTFGGTSCIMRFDHPQSYSFGNVYGDTLKNNLYFMMDDGIHGMELWRSDGTVAGTYMVADVNKSADIGGWSDLLSFKDKIFFCAKGNYSSSELWVSDGTEKGTKAFYGNGMTHLLGAMDFFSFGNKMVFRANTPGIGMELWISDGTQEGTVLLKDINPGNNSSNINYYTVLDSILYFGANDGKHGTEIWRSDGTTAGTFMAVESVPGQNSNYFSELNCGDHYLFMFGNDQIHGTEPWKYVPGDTCFLSAIPDRLCSGTSVSIGFSVFGKFDTSNIFSVFLSDSSGSFSGKMKIGEIKNQMSGDILVNIPAGLPDGNHYRLLLVSTQPAMVVTDPERHFSIHSQKPAAAGMISGSKEICSNEKNLVYSIPVINRADEYGWKTPGGISFQVKKNILTAWASDSAISGKMIVYGLNGCGAGDSSFLYIDIHKAYSDSIHVSLCTRDSFFAGGKYRRKTGIYYDSLQSVFGCDSVKVYDLYFGEYRIKTSVTICYGDSFFTGQRYITESGIFYDTLSSISDCDSILEFSIYERPKAEISRSGLTIYSNYRFGNQWYINDSLVPGGINNYIMILQNGKYFSIVDVPDCRYDTSNIIYVNDLAVEEEILKGSIKVYPNPAGDYLLINLNGDCHSEYHFILTDNIGKHISSGKIYCDRQGSGTIDLTGTKAGLYFLRISSKSGSRNFRIFKI